MCLVPRSSVMHEGMLWPQFAIKRRSHDVHRVRGVHSKEKTLTTTDRTSPPRPVQSWNSQLPPQLGIRLISIDVNGNST
ncbi:hypothetical protein KIL84_014182 [Mauremys mutica]|uniref:Uncharacterized protein n=1 Tax=Mauremys mutica TaxID=74926 RepID=A0A9D3XPA2_9SAUR|nr:hypothetical protein KIL84_014182 [Mauremys mutica]